MPTVSSRRRSDRLWFRHLHPMKIQAYKDDAKGSGGSGPVHDPPPHPAASSRGESEQPTPNPIPADSKRGPHGFESLLGDHAHLVSFPFAFTVSMILLAGFTMAACGMTVSNAALHVLGTIVTLL